MREKCELCNFYHKLCNQTVFDTTYLCLLFLDTYFTKKDQYEKAYYFYFCFYFTYMHGYNASSGAGYQINAIWS